MWIERLDRIVDDDGVMTHKSCCICFDMTPVEKLWVDKDGQKWDLCSKKCAEAAGMETEAGDDAE